MIAAYLRERLRPAMFGPLALLIGLAGSAGSVDALGLLADTAFALLLLAQFRLWDDLADRSFDAAVRPERVLVRAPSARQFVVACVVLGIVNLGLTMARGGVGVPVATLLSLHTLLGVWYWRRGPRSLAGDQLRLTKYPAFVFIVSGSRVAVAPGIIVLGAAAIYIAASLYEGWHDPASPLRALPGVRS